MLNAVMSRLVLVRNWKGNSWSFPRGKINQDESPFDCAIRETYEETGFNPRQYCNQEHVLTFREKQGKTAKMFIAVGVPEQAEFAPQTRKEISKVEFHDIYNLPKSNWGVLPFMQMLYKWIEKNYVCQKKSKRDKKKKGEKSGEAAVFDKRNQSTFGDIAGGHDTWGVEDMFTANAKLTGKEYVYDGNPHNFGSVHPRYVNYNQIVPASTQVQSEQQIATSTITAAVKISDCDTSADVRDLKMSENEETALAAQRDIAKIKAILKYLLLPKVDLLAPKSIKFDLLLRSIADQRKMVRKVKEAGGVKISNSRMTKIVQSTIMSNREEQALKPEAEQQLTHHLDAALMVKEVDSYLNAHYDDIAW